jgi:hypothetical protein
MVEAGGFGRSGEGTDTPFKPAQIQKEQFAGAAIAGSVEAYQAEIRNANKDIVDINKKQLSIQTQQLAEQKKISANTIKAESIVPVTLS